MQNWEALQTAANYEQHNNWYNNMFAANIKTEPDSQETSASTPMGMTTTHLEQYLRQQQQQQHQQPMDTLSAMTPSPGNSDANLSHFFDNTITQQQIYQQQFQQAQHAAAQNQMTSAHLPLGFNPLTPPGLPTAVLPPMSHFYNSNNNNNNHEENTTNHRNDTDEHAHSPQSTSNLQTILTDNNNDSKIQTALTPRNTPPMDITPPKSPKPVNEPHELKHQIHKAMDMKDGSVEKEHDLQSSSSEDIKYMAESEDDETIRMPIYNSHGKMKNYKCKSCGMVAITKVAFWDHARSHMKPEKILQCPKCPFVTELKHHLEYHIRKHKNLKPFQCDKCSYTCVNKSMLNSHRKSHSSVYQYRCADCDYATKYCHSFKLHLRKYEHQPGLVLDEEGLPNPSVVIDVYGTRRGPKNKSSTVASNGNKRNQDQNDLKMPTSQLSAALQGFPTMSASPTKSTSSNASDLTQTTKDSSSNQAMSSLLPPLASILQQNRNMAFFPYWNLNLQMLAVQQQAVLAQLSPRMRETALQQLQMKSESADEYDDQEDDAATVDQQDEHFDRKSVDSAMDLSQATPNHEEKIPDITPAKAINLKLLQEQSNETPVLANTAAVIKRKGRVLKLETKSSTQSPELESAIPAVSSPILKLDANTSADECMELASTANTAAANTSTSSTISTASSSGNSSNGSNTSSNSNSNSSSLHISPNAAGAIYECKYCDIFFKDAVLYTIHMGYHSCDDVFKCNMCGEKCDGPVGLFVHMARNAHS